MDITEDASPARRDLAEVEVDGELLLADSANVHRLNPTAALVWRQLDGSYRIGDLIDDLAEVTGAPREIVSDDVLDTIRSFLAQHLLRSLAADTDLPPVEVFDIGLPLEGSSLSEDHDHDHDHDDDGCGDPFASTDVKRGKVRYLEVVPSQ
jgi:hypothetical protein